MDIPRFQYEIIHELVSGSILPPTPLRKNIHKNRADNLATKHTKNTTPLQTLQPSGSTVNTGVFLAKTEGCTGACTNKADGTTGGKTDGSIGANKTDFSTGDNNTEGSTGANNTEGSTGAQQDRGLYWSPTRQRALL